MNVLFVTGVNKIINNKKIVFACHVFRNQPQACTASKNADCIINHIHVVHIPYGVEKERKTAQSSRERCVYLSRKRVWLCPGLMYGFSSMHGRKSFKTTLSALTEFHAWGFLGLMHHSERTYRPDEAAQNKLRKLQNHVVSVWEPHEIWCLFGGGLIFFFKRFS